MCCGVGGEGICIEGGGSWGLDCAGEKTACTIDVAEALWHLVSMLQCCVLFTYILGGHSYLATSIML